VPVFALNSTWKLQNHRFSSGTTLFVDHPGCLLAKKRRGQTESTHSSQLKALLSIKYAN